MAGPFDNIPIAEDPEFLRQMDPYYQPDLTPEAEAEPTDEELSTEVFSEAFERAMQAEDPSEEILMDERFMGSGPDPLAEMQFEPDFVGSGPDPSQPLDSFQQAMIANAPANLDVTPAEFGGNLGQPQAIDTLEADTALDNSFDRELDVTLDPYEEPPVDLGEIPLSDLNADAFAERRIDEELAAKEDRRQKVDAETLDLKARQDDNETFRRKNDEAHLAQTQAILKESVELGQVKIDPDRWYSSAGTGRKIGTWMSVLAGGQLGILSGRGGNEGLDFVLGEIGKDIDAQKANIMNKRAGLNQQQGLVAQVYQLTGDMFRAEQTAILTAFESMDARITAEMAGQDPEGTQAMEKEILLRNLRAKKAQHIAGLEEQSRNRSMEDTAFDMKQRDQQLKELKTKEEIIKLRKANRKRTGPGRPKESKLAAALRKQATKQPLTFDDRLLLEKYQHDVRKRNAEFGGAPKGEKEQADLDLAKVNIGLREQDLDRAKSGREVPGLLSQDGSGYEALTDREGTELRADKHALDTATALFDDISILRHEHGAELFGSQAGKKMDAKFSSLVLAMKEAKRTGALDDGSVKIITTMLIGGDKSASRTLRDFDEALESTRLDVVDAFNNKARALSKKKHRRYEPERKAIEKARRKTKEERRASITQGIPEIWRDDEQMRAKTVNQSTEDAGWHAKYDAHDLTELTDIGTDLQTKIGKGELTADEALTIATPMAKSLADKEWSLIIEAPRSELEKKFGTMDKADYFAGKLNDARKGDADAIYELFILRGYAEATKGK